MAEKVKKNTPNETVKSLWRKPLQVPPRTNAMRSFYQGEKEEVPAVNPKESQKKSLSKASSVSLKKEKEKEINKDEVISQEAENSVLNSEEPENNLLEAEVKNQSASHSIKKMSIENLSSLLGVEVEDLFDIHELLRGKSFEIYRTLFNSADEKGRCKITQLELMKISGIKNRRTFYKHEQWLINLNLLDKRHLPGDHKGVVYRVFEISEVLPISTEVVQQFRESLVS